MSLETIVAGQPIFTGDNALCGVYYTDLWYKVSKYKAPYVNGQVGEVIPFGMEDQNDMPHDCEICESALYVSKEAAEKHED